MNLCILFSSDAVTESPTVPITTIINGQASDTIDNTIIEISSIDATIVNDDTIDKHRMVRRNKNNGPPTVPYHTLINGELSISDENGVSSDTKYHICMVNRNYMYVSSTATYHSIVNGESSGTITNVAMNNIPIDATVITSTTTDHSFLTTFPDPNGINDEANATTIISTVDTSKKQGRQYHTTIICHTNLHVSCSNNYENISGAMDSDGMVLIIM